MAALQYVDVPGYSAVIVRRTYKDLSQPEGLIPRAKEWLFCHKDVHWSETDKRFTFPSKAQLSFAYLDGPDDHFHHQGAEYQFVGIDEAVQIRKDQALYLFSRLTKPSQKSEKNILSQIPLRFRCTSNPPAPEQRARGAWVKKRYIDERTRRKGTVFISAKLVDNPYTDQKQYRDSLMQMDSAIVVQQLLEGDWEIAVDGGMFEKDKWRYTNKLPEHQSNTNYWRHWVRYWDFAATEKTKEDTEPDWTVGALIGYTRTGEYYVAHQERFRLNPGRTEERVRETAEKDYKDKYNPHIYGEQEPGASGKQVIYHYLNHVLPGFPFRGDKPTGSKRTRAVPWSQVQNAGRVYLLRAEWNRDYVDEHEMFPDSEHDDQVDASSGAYSKLSGARPFISRA